MKIASKAWTFFIPLAILSVIFFFLGWGIAGGGLALVALWVVWFFRDPERLPPDSPGAIVSPADGKLDTLEIVEHPGFSNGKAIKLGIFLSIFDVHVNRACFKGRVGRIEHQSGRFLSAMNKESSRVNESNLIQLETEQGVIFIKQIAGMIARRIVCRLKTGDEVGVGDRIGMICFGSRTEVFLPTHANIKVKPGCTVRGGSTLLGVFAPEPEEAKKAANSNLALVDVE